MSVENYANEEAAYITIVEGPSPEFTATHESWTASLAEGIGSIVARCDMRTLNGQALVDRCKRAWAEGRPALLDYPMDPLSTATSTGRAEVEIVAARWEYVAEGQKLILWVKTDDFEEVDGGPFLQDNLED